MPYNPNYTPTIPEMKLSLRDRHNIWDKWTSQNEHGRNAGKYSCCLCSKVTFVAGERYDLMICWDCMFPEEVGESPLDKRRREQEEKQARGEALYRQQVKRGPSDPPKQKAGK